jgi:hypothetical protein
MCHGFADPAPEGQARRGVPVRRTLAALVLLVALAGASGAQSVRYLYRTAPALVGLPGLAASGPYQNAVDVILEQAIRNLPLFPAASSTYTYRWDAAQGALVRVDDAVSPATTVTTSATIPSRCRSAAGQRFATTPTAGRNGRRRGPRSRRSRTESQQ